MNDNEHHDRWTYLVSGFDQKKRELVCIMAGNPTTAEYVAGLFREAGLARVEWTNTKLPCGGSGADT